MGFLGKWFVTAIACAVAIWLVPGIVPVGGTWVGPIRSAHSCSRCSTPP